MKIHTGRGVLCAWCVLWAIVPFAPAQEAMYTAAATMPSKGTGVLREQAHIFRYKANPTTGDARTDTFEVMTSIQYGLARGLSVNLDIPVAFERDENSAGNADWDKGVENLDVMFKYRFYQNDSGGINTTRIALLGGAKFASGDDHDFSSKSIDPHLGIVFTEVIGRHGFNQELHYTLNTGGMKESNLGGEGPSDALALNLAYVYRIFPARYTSDTIGAWYVTAELNTLYETNSDIETRFSPGIMYEGRGFGLEVMAQLPLWSDLDDRPELEWAIGAGLRFSF